MKGKFIGAIICVLIMVACPVIAATSEGDEANDTTQAVSIKLSDLSTTEVKDLFDNGSTNTNVESFIFNILDTPLYLNSSLFSNSTKALEVSKFNYEAGEKKVYTSDGKTYTMANFVKTSMDFTLTLTCSSSMKLLSTGSNNNYAGEGVSKLISSYADRTVYSGEIIKIQGSMSIINNYTDEYYDIFTGSDGYKYCKHCKPSSQYGDMKMSWNVSVYDNSQKLFSDTIDQTIVEDYDYVYKMINGSESSYTSGKVESCDYVAKYTSTCSGGKTINNSSYEYYDLTPNIDVANTDCTSALPPVSTVDTTCSYNDLAMLGNCNDISSKVSKYGGTASTSASTFDSLYGTITPVFKNTVTLRFIVNDFRYGMLSTDTITVNKGATVSIDGNTLKIGGKTVLAYPSDSTDGHNYSLKNWGLKNGDVINEDSAVLVEFQQSNSDDNTMYIAIIVLLAILAIVLLGYIVYERKKA